ncbi:MAG: porin [Alphaproteobacteria bacterium]|nr:porin [Alphaproteobacteria bacterium]
MRKILLGTTAVIGATVLAAPAFAQGALNVRIGGYYNFQYGHISEKSLVTATERAGKSDFRSDGEIHVLVTGKAANGLTYGATLEMEMDGNASRNLFSVDEWYGFIGTPTLGQLRFGDEDGAASLMQVWIPTNFGAGGADGNFDDYILGRPGNGIGSSVPLGNLAEIGDNSKIIYLSPQFFGFDVGVSYALNAGQGETSGTTPGSGTLAGADRLVASAAGGARRNEWNIAARWRGSFGPVGLAVGAGAFISGVTKARAAGVETKAFQDIRIYNVGLNVTFAGLTAGAAYMWGQFGGVGGMGTALPVNPAGFSANNGRVLALGVAYRFGAFTVGANFMGGSREGRVGAAFANDQKTRHWAIGGTYNLAPGLDVFAEYVNFRYTDDDAAATKNNGSAILIGTRLAW